jgi:hypothetical protein
LAATTSPFWKKYTEVLKSFSSQTDTNAFLVEMTGVARKVKIVLQKMVSFNVEMDFFGKELIEEIVEKLMQNW